MTIHILVEGSSERAFFDRWLPRSFPHQHIRVHPHQGKGALPKRTDGAPDLKARGLLDQLPAKLRGFARALNPEVDGILVLLDADDDDVEVLTQRIEAVAETCAPELRVKVSFAVEEMEAFYLGDLRALKRAYPDADLETARAYEPDSICGTWELFGDVIGDDGGNKVAWAEAMGPYVTTIPSQNRSPSFRRMVAEILHLTPTAKIAKKRKQYHHVSKKMKKN